MNNCKMLYKGIFWIKDLEQPKEAHICCRIPVDVNGVVAAEFFKQQLNSKNWDNYNHRKTWQMLDKKDTEGKAYDYYPRGRVEIKRGKAVIYTNPHLCNDLIHDWIVKEFGLLETNGITLVTVKPDYSVHYRCYLDEE